MKPKSLTELLREVALANPVCGRCGERIAGSYTGLCEDCTVAEWVRWRSRGKNVSRPHLAIADKN
jgi:hypothetical protein